MTTIFEGISIFMLQRVSEWRWDKKKICWYPNFQCSVGSFFFLRCLVFHLKSSSLLTWAQSNSSLVDDIVLYCRYRLPFCLWDFNVLRLTPFHTSSMYTLHPSAQYNNLGKCYCLFEMRDDRENSFDNLSIVYICYCCNCCDIFIWIYILALVSIKFNT